MPRVNSAIISAIGLQTAQILLRAMASPSHLEKGGLIACIKWASAVSRFLAMRLRRVTFVPYLAALATAGLVGAFNPRGWTVVFTSALPAAAAAFGLTQMDHFRRATSLNPFVPAAGPMTRSHGWIAAATLVLAFFMACLGREYASVSGKT